VEATRKGDELEGLVTEAWDAAASDLDLRSTDALVAAMNEADATVAHAVARARPSLVHAIDAIVERLVSGGRLVYAGAGTSGRLALVDAVECGTTFGLPDGRVLALVAGGAESTAAAQEHAEDDRDAGAFDIGGVDVGPADAVVGISASGRPPYAVGALEEARRRGALTVALVCVDQSELAAVAEHEIVVVVGSEVIAGSTRLKAGTAQKLVLNTISTVALVRLGKTFGNLMVDVVATNDKLRARVRRIVRLATGVSADVADETLDAAGGDAKVAIVALLADVDVDAARARLERAGGVVRKALAP
jgi:N-acetylmuramic acid 6-phosphate etherase